MLSRFSNHQRPRLAGDFLPWVGPSAKKRHTRSDVMKMFLTTLGLLVAAPAAHAEDEGCYNLSLIHISEPTRPY